MGVSGYGTDQELLLFRQLGKQLQPSAVLLMVSQNDFDNIASHEQYFRFKPQFQLEGAKLALASTEVPPPTIRQRIITTVYERTFLLSRLLSRALKIFHSLSVRPSDETVPVADSASETLFCQLLLLLKNDTSLAHASLLVAEIPPTRGRVQRCAASLRIPYLDLTSTFDASKKEKFLIPGDEHWNSYGHLLAGRQISSWLSQVNIN